MPKHSTGSNKVISACLNEAQTDSTTIAQDLVAVRDKIKQWEIEIEEQERMSKVSEACKALNTASALTQVQNPGSFSRKRKWDDFDDVVKHAQNVLDLHKKLRSEGATNTRTPSEVGVAAETAQKPES